MTTIIEAHPRADGIAWDNADVGDYIVRRDDHSQWFTINAIHSQTDQRLHARVTNQHGDATASLTLHNTSYQIWRDFAPAQQTGDNMSTTDPRPEIYAEVLEVINRIINRHAKTNELCDQGMRAFRAEVNRELGFAALSEPPAEEISVVLSWGFNVEGINSDDFDGDQLVNELGSVVEMLENRVRNHFEARALLMSDTANTFGWSCDTVIRP